MQYGMGAESSSVAMAASFSEVYVCQLSFASNFHSTGLDDYLDIFLPFSQWLTHIWKPHFCTACYTPGSGM